MTCEVGGKQLSIDQRLVDHSKELGIPSSFIGAIKLTMAVTQARASFDAEVLVLPVGFQVQGLSTLRVLRKGQNMPQLTIAWLFISVQYISMIVTGAAGTNDSLYLCYQIICINPCSL
jgi:hypothetical protein